MSGQLHDAVLLEHNVIRKHAVDTAAERARLGLGAGVTAIPALEEIAGDAIADLHAADAGADFDHLAGAVGERDHVRLRRHAIAAEHDRKIAEIERAGRDLHQDLPVGGLWLRQIDLSESVDAGGLGQLECAHVILANAWVGNVTDRVSLLKPGRRSNRIGSRAVAPDLQTLSAPTLRHPNLF